ncbi:MAG: hypothetical protein P9M15_02325, partial [Candidatus Electryoneaceae bacterium]|nr:hypothetical protein [Candidatus Electryoneaceae bacterium]
PHFAIYYAVKANPHPAILKLMAENQLGADVTSAGEMQLVIENGIKPERISFSGPGKTEDELTKAVEYGIGSINAESLEEIHQLLDICRRLQRVTNVGVRVNPVGKPIKSGLRMAGATQFGIPEDQTERAIRFIRENEDAFNFSGIHIHSGSQILDNDIIVNHIQSVLDMALRLEELCGVRMKKINCGGGWGIDYFPNQQPIDLEIISEELLDLFDESPYRELSKRAELIIEPGRYVVGEAGIYVTKVLYRKRIGSKEFAVVDGGMHHNYLLAGGMGQVIRRNFEMAILRNNTDQIDTRRFQLTIAGKLCSPQDILAHDYQCEEEVYPGEYVIFFNCGAYGLTASPSDFLSHPKPMEYFLENTFI